MMTLLLNVSATLLFALTALLGRGPGPGSGNGNGNGSGNGNGGPSGTPCAACQVADPAATSLSATEKESLLYMREEEKLARDVYNAFYLSLIHIWTGGGR